jgi:DNA-binding NarL/FixJ family response regulator
MGLRLLLVDDHAGFRRLTRMLLQRFNFDVVGEAGDGREALRLARVLEPELVLLDVLLPDLDGFTVAARLSELFRPPAVVLTSSRSAADFGVRVSDAPVRGFLAKDELTPQRLLEIAGPLGRDARCG